APSAGGHGRGNEVRGEAAGTDAPRQEGFAPVLPTGREGCLVDPHRRRPTIRHVRLSRPDVLRDVPRRVQEEGRWDRQRVGIRPRLRRGKVQGRVTPPTCCYRERVEGAAWDVPADPGAAADVGAI